MTSEHSSEPDPRKKRALIIGGVIAVAAILWNVEGWTGNDSPVIISVDGDRENIHDARDAVRSVLRDEIRSSIRGDEDQADEDATEADNSEAAAQDETATEESGTGERRLVETESGENQRTFRIEGDDGRGVTISVDADSAN